MPSLVRNFNQWATGLLNVSRPDYLRSPFTQGQLQKIVWSDIFGTEYTPLSRAEAMTIPSVSKARALITTTIAKLPLVALNKDGKLADEKQPTWCYRTDGAITPFLRMVWTLDDLIFYGASLWQVDRGSEGDILNAERVPFEHWTVSPAGAILLNDQPVDVDDVIYFSAPIEGLLDRASIALAAARDIDAAVANRAKNPIPVTEIHELEETQLTPQEQKELVESYNKARRDPEGVTVFTPKEIELRMHGEKGETGFMTAGRNAVRLDVANFTNVPAALLDGSVSEASLTYSTQEGRRNEFVDYGLSQWIEAVQTRLSQDDVVPRGQRIRFDLTDFLTTLPEPTGAPVKD